MTLIKPDLLVVHPVDMDFPGFRVQAHKFRDHFNKIILSFSQHHCGPDISSWVLGTMNANGDHVEGIPWEMVSREPYQDWGQRAVIAGMKRVTSPYVLVSQQDFIVYNDNFFDIVLDTNARLVSHTGYIAPPTCLGTSPPVYLSRFEPDFILLEMNLWNLSDKDISAQPPKYDHWGAWSASIQTIHSEAKVLEDFGLASPTDWEHLTGLCYNYALLREGKFDSIILGDRRSRFIDYNKYLLTLNTPMYPTVLDRIKQAAQMSY